MRQGSVPTAEPSFAPEGSGSSHFRDSSVLRRMHQSMVMVFATAVLFTRADSASPRRDKRNPAFLETMAFVNPMSSPLLHLT